VEPAVRTEAEVARSAVLRGDLGPSTRWLASVHGADDPATLATAHAMRALRACADPASGRFASVEELAPLRGLGDDVERAIFACARDAVLACDLERLARYAALSADPDALVHAWVAIARGDGARAAAIAGASQSTADPADRIESTCLRALAAATTGDVRGARTLARRASRMARTEDLPQSQYLSNLVLARIRRLGGAPHLALRILDSLGHVAPAAWSERLAWELALAGRAPEGEGAAATAWRQLYAACRAGDPDAYAEAADALRECARRWPARAADAEAALGLCDVRVDSATLSEPLRSFIEGVDHDVPGVVSGLCCGAGPVPSRVHTFVAPMGRGRRVAGLAAPLARAVAGVEHEPVRSGRTNEAISVLALAGPDGLGREALFERVYGFAFRQVSHGTLLRVLLHRMRKWLDGIGAVELVDGQVTLALERPLLIPDVRCEYSLEERVLRSLSRASHQSIRETAEQLGVPLRTAQEALQALREDGAVSERRAGRRVQYRVEDTTFSEPTRWNLGERPP